MAIDRWGIGQALNQTLPQERVRQLLTHQKIHLLLGITMGSCPDKLPICWQYPYVENTLNTPNLVRGYGTQSAGASPLRLRGSLGTAARCHCPASQERTMLQITGPEKDPNAKFEVTVSTKCMSLSHHHEAEKFKSNYPDSGNNSINITKITGIFFFFNYWICTLGINISQVTEFIQSY